MQTGAGGSDDGDVGGVVERDSEAYMNPHILDPLAIWKTALMLGFATGLYLGLSIVGIFWLIFVH